MKTPSPSIFRPAGGIDRRVAENSKALLAEIDRRKILRGAASLGALLSAAPELEVGPDLIWEALVEALVRGLTDVKA